jgi:hypothetical protein
MMIFRRFRISAAAVAFTCCAIASAKLIDTGLGDLVRQSDFVAYGHSKMNPKSPPSLDSSTVAFEPIVVLKVPKERNVSAITLCNTPIDTETYDLTKIKGNYIVFAAKRELCFRPVHGIGSIIMVDEKRARTLAIADEPDSQPIDAFIAKIRSLVDHN